MTRLAHDRWLQGVRVIEVTTGVSAPLTGRVLSDLGAEVIRVESRLKIDVNRNRLPPRGVDEADLPPAIERFPLLQESNSGKKSVTLNLKHEDGLETLMRLLETADCFVENFAPGWLERLGSSFAEIRERFPRLVILSMTGYGQTGPLKSMRAYAPTMTSLAGLEGLVGYAPDDIQGMMATAWADLNGSYMAASTLLTALVGRQRTGTGVHLDFSLTEGSSALLGEAFVDAQRNAEDPAPAGNVGLDEQVWRLYRCVGDDEWLAVAGGSNDQWPEEDAFLGEDKWTAAQKLQQEGLEATPVLSPAEVDLDLGFRDRSLVQQLPHPHLGRTEVTSLPWLVEDRVPRMASAAPLLGEHTAEVFGELLGMTADEIEQGVSDGLFH